MATVIVALLLAKAQSARQSAIAARRLEAISATDKLLQAWWAHPDRIPRRSVGAIADARDMSWRTTRIASTDLRRLGAEIVRVEVVDTSSSTLLTSVEIVLPSTASP
jgi:hypothetical protein